MLRINTRLVLLAALTGALPATPAAADSVTLKRSVRMPNDRAHLTLGDVATLEGPIVEPLRDLTIWTNPDPASLQTLSLDAIRAALTDARVHWGSVHLSGGDVLVRPRPAHDGPGPRAMETASVTGVAPAQATEATANEFTADALVNEATIRGAVARRLVQHLRRPASDVRLTFEPRAAGAESLDQSPADRLIEIAPLSALDTDRVELAVRLWRDGRVERSFPVTLHLSLRLPVPVLSRDVSKGDAIDASMVASAHEWRKPSEARAIAAPESIAGRQAARPMRAGSPLLERDLEQQRVIRRGDRVVVRCLSGGIVITLEAEARTEGGVGDAIELRKFGERTAFSAVITGPGEAVIDLRSPTVVGR